jgi:hypothetical protein
MGFFSWNCKKCDHSIKAPHSIPTGWNYMNEAVWVREEEDPVLGTYDGYGQITTLRFNPAEDETQDITWVEPELWHRVCWENSGKPEYTSPSDRAGDQGYFYEEPTEKEMMKAIKATK